MAKGYKHTIKRGSPFSERYRVTESGCWEWIGSTNSLGYGQTWANGKSVPAHRYSYELAFGSIPDGLCVCHRCDNRKCVNPDHLFLGTYQDNVSDMIAKGRHRPNRGTNNGRAKLTDDQVVAIRERYNVGDVGVDDLAREYKVGSTTIGQVVRGEKWRHIGGKCKKRDAASNAKITREVAEEIRQRLAAGGASQASIGRLYGLSPATISRIANGVAWKGGADGKR